MKIPRPPFLLLYYLASRLLVSNDLRAAVTIVDTFDQGGFSQSCCNEAEDNVDLPFGSRRIVSFKQGGIGSQWTTNAATLDSNTGKLSYIVNGTSPPETSPLGLQLIYAGSGPHNILGSTGFILGFSELSGVGSLYIEFGSAPGSDGIQRIDLTGPGEVFFPTASVRPTTSHSVDSFSILRFVFEARSPQFSFTLDEIRLVPEPGSAAFLLTAGAGWLSLRRRRP